MGPRVVLVSSKASANVGAAARAMKNFGLDDLVLVAPRCAIDRDAYALASHAGDVLDGARVVDTVGEAVADRTLVLGTSARLRRGEGLPVREPRSAAHDLLSQRAAVLFGPEDHGLDNDALNLCQGYVSIPTAAYASLNLAQAVVVVAYEVHLAGLASGTPGAHDAGPRGDAGAEGGVPGRGHGARVPEPAERASREQMERFYAQMLASFHLIGFTDAMRERGIDRLFRGMFDRVALTPREVAALRGLLSQVTWAAERDPSELPGRSSA